MKTLLSGKQLDLHKLVSKDETKKAQCGIFIKGNEATVTNGHYLMIVKSKANVSPGDFPANGVKWVGGMDGFILDAENAKQARKTLPKDKHLPPVIKHAAIGLAEETDGIVTNVLQTTDYETFNTFKPETIDGHFPDIKRAGIIPDYLDENIYQRVAVNAGYLKDILAQLEKYKKSGMVTLYVCTKDKKIRATKKRSGSTRKAETFPMVVTTQDDDIENEAMAMIMPMRL